MTVCMCMYVCAAPCTVSRNDGVSLRNGVWCVCMCVCVYVCVYAIAIVILTIVFLTRIATVDMVLCDDTVQPAISNTVHRVATGTTKYATKAGS